MVLALLLPVLLLASACGSDAPDKEGPEYWPTDGWQTRNPSEHGFDSAVLEAISESLGEEIPFLDSLLVIRDGYIIYEQYFNGYGAGDPHNIASVTKSWTSAAAGVASGRPEGPGLDESLAELLPGYFEAGENADKAGITYRSLLQMRSGIAFSEDGLDSGVYGTYQELAGQDLVSWGLDLPLAYEPGEAWNYSTLDSQFVSAVLHEAMGVSLEELLRDSLFEPMGITSYAWFADAAGTTIGGQQLSLTPRDMAKLGLLYLEGGVWDREQLIPAEWVEESTTPQGTSAYYANSAGVIEIDWYGYHWWTWGPEWFGGYSGLQAKGFGGQQVLILPELELIVVTTAQTDDIQPSEATEQEAVIYAFLLDQLFPALDEVEWDFGD